MLVFRWALPGKFNNKGPLKSYQGSPQRKVDRRPIPSLFKGRAGADVSG